MNNIIIGLFVVMTSLGFAQKKNKRWSDDIKRKPKPVVPYEELKPFVKDNESVVTYDAGDFNGDKMLDVILVVTHENEQKLSVSQNKQVNRKVLILKRNFQNVLEKTHENDSVIYCYLCESTEGSPLTSVEFKGNQFSIQHEAGKTNRWARILTFEYDQEKQIWLLLKDATSQYNITSSKGLVSEVKTQNDFGFITFDRVDVYEKDLRKKNKTE